MKIERIYTSPRSGEAQVEQELVRVEAGRGIEGDRYFDRHGEPGQNVTLVEVEVLQAFLEEQGRVRDLSLTHRNLLTRGVRLNELVGAEFRVGEVKLRGVELCEPCLGFGTALSSATISPAQVVRRFLHRGGLRADAVSGGIIRRGDAITVPAMHPLT